MAPGNVDWGASDSSDDETVSLTSTVFSEEKDEPYNLEAVLAERMFEDGKKRYLVKWEGYPDYRNTWEKRKHFQFEQTLLDWRDQKMQFTRGRAKPFDVDAWEREVERIRETTEKRRARRREKKISLGISVDEHEEIEPGSPEYSSSSDDSSNESSSEASEEFTGSDLQSRATSPAWTPREESSLLEALQRLKEPDWNAVLELYGSLGTINQALRQRTKGALRRKAFSLKKDFDASGKEFPIPVLNDQPSSGKSFTISVSSGRKVDRARTSRDEHRLELVESLKSVGKGDVSKLGRVSEPASSRKTKSDHRLPQRNRKPEHLRVTIPAHTSKTSEVRSATAASQSSADTKTPARPASAAPWIPNRPVTERPTQLGTVGRGPARKGFPKPAPIQRGNVMGNWAAQPTKRRKSRYDMKAPTDPRAENPSKFKKFSTQRKFDIAGRFERPPDVNSLTFIDLKDGKVLPKPPASVARKPPEKPPFQMLQESMKEKQDEASPLSDDTPLSAIQVTSTAESYMNERRLSKSNNQSANAVDGANETAESIAPIRRTSFPIETYTQCQTSSEQPFTAPVAMMGFCKEPSLNATSPERRHTYPHASSQTTRENELGKTGVDVNKGVVHRASIDALHQIEGRTKIEINPGSKIHNHSENSDPQRQKPSMPLLGKLLQSDMKRRAETTNNEVPVPAAQLQPNIPCFQPLQDGYALFPFDFIGSGGERTNFCKQTDVIAEILTGPAGDSTGAVIFRGLENLDLKMLFLTIRVPPRQMHVKCETMCTAGEYATFFHAPPRYLGSGWIAPFVQAIKDVDRLSKLLAEHASGALFFADRFSLLIYPTRCVAWRFLDTGFACNPPPEAKLRFAMFTAQLQLQEINPSCPGVGLVAPTTDVKNLHINRVFQTHFGMEFSRICARSSDKDIIKTPSTNTFFLLFPPAVREDCKLFIEWIQANSTAATIYRHEDRGAWEHFYKSVENGVIICHALFNEYWAMPYLSHVLKKSISMFSFSSEPMACDAPDAHLIRLFPAGQAILLTDSLFLLRPLESARILAWFRLFALPTKPPGTWKVCTRPAIHDWLWSVQERYHYPHGEVFVRCYGEIMRLLPTDLTKEWDCEAPTDTAPVVCMSGSARNFDQTLGTSQDLDDRQIMKNDVALVDWFVGWAMTKQEKCRRFYVVTGRKEESDQHKKLKESARKYNHVRVMSLEEFENSLKIWDWARIEREDEQRREEAAKADEELRRETTASEQSPDLPDYEDEDMPHSKMAEEESLFLPMDVSV
ncbi:MAG: hypothetical protein Q9221_004883 [Calogaya cf. arnoldii]